MISSFTSNKSTFELENLATYNGTAGSLWVEWLQKTDGRVFNGRAFVAGSRPTRKDVETSFQPWLIPDFSQIRRRQI